MRCAERHSCDLFVRFPSENGSSRVYMAEAAADPLDFFVMRLA
jgi:hypothetical protein